MCNAYNHRLGCDCGWGGSNHGGNGSGNFRNLLSFQSTDIVSQASVSSKYDDEAKTFLTPCPWCDVSVYYHTNGYGDSVYFDSLGYPWQVHECFKNYWESEKSTRHLNSTQISLSQWHNFFEVGINEQKRLILIGAAHQIQNVETGTSFIHGVTEEALAKQMDISVDLLRANYEHLYFREVDGIRFFTDEQKRLKLANAAHRIPDATVGHFLVYKATELSLANQMEIPVDQLRKSYGHLYTQESSGIKILPEQELKYRREARIKTQVPWNSITVTQTLHH